MAALKITGQSAEPTVTSSDAGTMYYDSDTNKLRHYNGSAWADVSGVVGMIAPFAMASAPNGWLICNGSRVSTTTYAALVTAIYVGDGSNASTSIEWGQKWDAATGGSRSTSGTYLSLPDLEGAFLRGTGGNATHTMANAGAFTGPAVGAFEDDQTQRHKHTTSTSPHLLSAVDLGGWGFAESPSNNKSAASYTSSSPETDAFGTPRTGDETRPFNAGVNYCIKF